MNLSNGVHKGVSFPDYHAVEAWSSSALRAMRKGPPARVLWERDNPTPDTDATKFGTAVHCAFITPELYEACHAHKPDGMSFATKEGKAWRDAPEQKGKVVVDHDSWTRCAAVVDALGAKDLVYRSFVSSQLREATIIAIDPETGERVKARPDWIDGDGRIVDLKCSTHATRPHSLAYRAFVEGWMHQVAWYRYVARLAGLNVDGGRLVVVAPDAPHYVWALEVKPDALDMLAYENADTLEALSECRKKNEWPDTPDTWTYIEPPPAALAEVDLPPITEEEAA